MCLRKNLAQSRRQHGFTQTEAAMAAAITPRHYKSLESGESNGSIPVWESLRTLLDAPSIDYLLQDDRPAS